MEKEGLFVQSQSYGLESVRESEINRLQLQYRSHFGNDVSRPEVWVSKHIQIYLNALAISIRARVWRPKDFQKLSEKAVKLRRDALQAFASYLGYVPTGDDVLRELKRKVVVPQHIAAFIYQDVQHLRTEVTVPAKGKVSGKRTRS